MAFLLLTGESFVPSTRDDDCTSGKAAALVYEWGLHTAKVEEKLYKIKDSAGRNCVSKLLQRNASDRLGVSEALEHILLNPKASDADIKLALDKIVKSQANIEKSQARIEKGIIELNHLAKETLEQVKRSEEVLRKAVFESTEILTPTCFVILPRKFGDDGDAPKNDEGETALAFRDLLGIADEALSLVEADTGESEADEDEKKGHEEEEPAGITSESQEKKSTGFCSKIGKAQQSRTHIRYL